jgi:hypothetical protein
MALRQFIVVSLFPNLVAGFAPQTDQGIMRRETPWQAHLDASGKMLMERQAKAKVRGDLCDDIFITGDEGAKVCPDRTEPLRVVPDPFICQAAARGNLTLNNFVLSTEWFDVHPPGCFIEDGKYFYNPTGRDSNATLAGAPICMTRLFQNGTDHSASCGNDDYKIITSEATCRYAAGCLSHCEEAEFRVLDPDVQDKRPPGCFVRSDRCYGFNPKTDPDDLPANIESGTPVCRHKTDPVDIPAGSDLQVEDATFVADSSKVLDGETIEDSGDNPCSYLGCNSHKCEWVSGGRISRVVAGKSCSNAVVKGSGEDAASVKGGTSAKISTLKDCVDVIRKEQGGSCSGHFQLHKETMTCACVPAGDHCTEQEDQKVCRFIVKD